MIYFDNAATTSPLKEVLSLYVEKCQNVPGNSSSTHALGRKANRELDEARNQILAAFGLERTHNLIFTCGATEGNNLSIKGVCKLYKNRGNKIITSSVEHPSVLNVFKELESEGFEVVYLPVNSEGKVLPSSLEEAMDNKTILVSIMGVNNEVGAINDMNALADIVHKYPKALFHSDMTQAVGKVKMPYNKIDMFTYSTHKIGGLRGDGALIYLKKIQFAPVFDGGGQEGGFRSGTVDVPCALSHALALKEAIKRMPNKVVHVKEIYDYLRENLGKLDEISFNSPLDGSVFVLNISLKHKKASVILEALSQREIYVSSVSACSSKGEPISNVLLAMGKSEGDARNSLRLSFSESNSIDEAKEFMTQFMDVLERTINR